MWCSCKTGFSRLLWDSVHLPEGACLFTCTRSGPPGRSTTSSRDHLTVSKCGGIYAFIAASGSSGRNRHSGSLPFTSCFHPNVAHSSSGSSPEVRMSGIKCSCFLPVESLFSAMLSASGKSCISSGNTKASPDTSLTGYRRIPFSPYALIS